MSATGLEITTFEYPDDVDAPSDFQLVPGNLSFNFQQKGNVRSLSTSYASQSSDLTGFLYLPTLSDAACANASAAYVPKNVTSQSDLSSRNSLVAIAPWISPACTLAYLDAAPSDSTNAFVFFLVDPDDGSLPPADDAAWSLGDGSQWKSTTNFPVYAVTTQLGTMILNQMSHYSGNVSTVPYGAELIKSYAYPVDAYVRLYIDIRTGGGSGLPSIWVFLLIILAILLFLIGLLSLAMHLIQRRRRNALRASIARGDVDVEALGIGKLTVPQDMIEKLPLYVYASASDPAVEKPASHSLPQLHQPTCAICLDDFVPSNSRVRQLPCRHVFHPECIDLFLRENSSLCPLCKKSVLPQGYCPTKVTNYMVRRERHMRRTRARAAARLSSEHQEAPRRERRFSIFRRDATSLPPPVEMTSVDATEAATAASPRLTSGRREWAQRRALAMLGPRATSHGAEQEPTTSRSRKLLRSIFPGF